MRPRCLRKGPTVNPIPTFALEVRGSELFAFLPENIDNEPLPTFTARVPENVSLGEGPGEEARAWAPRTDGLCLRGGVAPLYSLFRRCATRPSSSSEEARPDWLQLKSSAVWDLRVRGWRLGVADVALVARHLKASRLEGEVPGSVSSQGRF